MVAPGLRVWLDDHRPAPPGWVCAETPEQVIALLRTGAVTRVSLDHDLRLESGRNGRVVLARGSGSLVTLRLSASPDVDGAFSRHVGHSRVGRVFSRRMEEPR
jgi:hypothetical protein